VDNRGDASCDPGLKVHGHAVFEWLDGEKFLIVRAQSDHPDFPNSISIIADTALGRIEAMPCSHFVAWAPRK
jgi:hypothetical protein